MTPRAGRPDRRLGWLLHVAVVLATVSQLAFNLLPLLDGWRGIGAGPHIEAVGGTPHYAHDEDTCAACHVHVLDARPAATVRLAVGYDQAPRAPAGGGSFAPPAAPTSAHHSRAPPTVN